MKMYKREVACLAAIVLLTAAVFAVDEKGVMDTMKAGAAEMMKHDANMPMKTPMDGNCPKGMMMDKCWQMTPEQIMKCCGMSPAMVDKCTMMLNAQIMPTDPVAMMAMKDKLMLTPEQMGKLDAIAKKAREDAAMVLTAQQSDMVSGMAATPATMMEMHNMMMQKMKEKGMMAPADTTGKAGAMMEQTTCPVSGKPINKMYSTVYKGKTVYFCCPMCKPIFDKAAEKYLSALPQFAQ